MKMFEKFGPISKIDFLWHKTGPKKGEPRGYCFLEYVNAPDAARAITEMNGKPLSGRNLSVNYPKSLPPEVTEYGERSDPVNAKLQPKASNSSTESKIAILERKLQELDNPKPSATSASKSSNNNSSPGDFNRRGGQTSISSDRGRYGGSGGSYGGRGGSFGGGRGRGSGGYTNRSGGTRRGS
ncbi:hypothetical protein HDU76_011105 [Blyttiomyces sp. JEL0837]|nr:hypothetical protein HDU76_011105 [Blyttiomyces sp. JEL0837]